MKENTREILQECGVRHDALRGLTEEIEKAFVVIADSFKKGGRLYLCGNGGSASDCEHIAGELLKSFKKPRPLQTEFVEGLKSLGEEGKLVAASLDGGLPAVSLCGHPAFSTAYLNDKDPSFIFAQQVNVFGKAGDVLLTLSTSGNSKNCVYAAMVAKAKGMSVVFLGGGTGGTLKTVADVSLIVPEKETYKVQELHLPLYHCLCAMLEEEFF